MRTIGVMQLLFKGLAVFASVGLLLAGCQTINQEQALSPRQKELKMKLTDMQYKVTQEDATEPAFNNEYWDHKEPGIYVDVVSGKPLFSSLDKFESGTGWPSFTKPIDESVVKMEQDTSYGMVRTEVRSTEADSHLGHLFDDGPAPTNDRYCINSAALRFVPVDKLEEEGYGEYLPLFESEGAKQVAEGA